MERVYHRYATNKSWKNFRIQKQNYRDMLKWAKTEAVSEKVAECSKDTKQLYKIVNNILGTTNEKPLPPSDDKIKLADEFANYFIEKIQKKSETNLTHMINTCHGTKKYHHYLNMIQ